jgi:hypothetical protein
MRFKYRIASTLMTACLLLLSCKLGVLGDEGSEEVCCWWMWFPELGGMRGGWGMEEDEK